jgi:hypothetical protein
MAGLSWWFFRIGGLPGRSDLAVRVDGAVLHGDDRDVDQAKTDFKPPFKKRQVINYYAYVLSK